MAGWMDLTRPDARSNWQEEEIESLSCVIARSLRTIASNYDREDLNTTEENQLEWHGHIRRSNDNRRVTKKQELQFSGTKGRIRNLRWPAFKDIIGPVVSENLYHEHNK